ncbi:Leukocyte receptor cluster (LRC) member 8 [Cyanidiococcus yangmingshanensis]|uniref:Leukocyte receptor cluster (LRC) member 8 n=1 Tax=Cyanidiococcus yangmingshanensis TaxID=2690220 RepID=A0A7J7IN52_9RHOD|nr:Leukocyte receptor cluster (LRC) member 8 [Cyanidiococcus yangmingshanensis]
MQSVTNQQQLVDANLQYYRALLPPNVSYHLHESGREYIFDANLGTTRWLWERQTIPNPNALDPNQAIIVYVNCVDGRRTWALPIFRSPKSENAFGPVTQPRNDNEHSPREQTSSAPHQSGAARGPELRQQHQPVGLGHRSFVDATSESQDGSKHNANHLSAKGSKTATLGHEGSSGSQKQLNNKPGRVRSRDYDQESQMFGSVVEPSDRYALAWRSRTTVSGLVAGKDRGQRLVGQSNDTHALRIETVRRLARAERFREHLNPEKSRDCGASDHRSAAREKSRHHASKSDGRLVGTSEALEKGYLRLTKAAQPDQVRPLSVLQTAFAQLMSRWERDHLEYSFISEQLKAIRQDLQVQGLGAQCRLTFDVYETHARLAILHDDVAELSQCLSVLKTLYHENRSEANSNRKEFLGYRVLLALYSGGLLDIRLMLREDNLLADAAIAALDAVDSSDTLVTTMQLAIACARHDYFSFMRIRNRLPATARRLVSWFERRATEEALNTIQTAYRPSVPLHLVEHLLGQDPQRTSSPERQAPVGVSRTNDEENLEPGTQPSLVRLLARHGAQLSADGQMMICDRRPSRRPKVVPFVTETT